MNHALVEIVLAFSVSSSIAHMIRACFAVTAGEGVSETRDALPMDPPDKPHPTLHQEQEFSPVEKGVDQADQPRAAHSFAALMDEEEAQGEVQQLAAHNGKCSVP